MTDADVRAVRDALLPAIDRDLTRRSRRPRFGLALVAATAVAAGGTGVAAATGVLFADPKPLAVAAAPFDWQRFEHDPWDPSGRGGPVEVRPKPEAVARTNAAMEANLSELGVTARCGTDTEHPLACFLPNGDLVDGETAAEALRRLDGIEILESSRANYEIRTPR